MSVPFRTEIFGAGSTVTVQLALGADITASPLTWTWTDCTILVMQSPGLTGTWGRADETSQTTPGGFEFSLWNITGIFSAYAAGIGFNSKATPVRILRNIAGAGNVVEFQGRSVGFTPTWDTSGKWPIVKVVAAGRMRQLGQPKTPAQSALYRAMSKSNPIAYWSMEEGANAVKFSSAVAGVAALAITGAIALGSVAGPGSAAGPDFTGDGQASATLFAPAVTSPWRVAFAFSPKAATANYVPLQWVTSSGVTWAIQVGLNAATADVTVGTGGSVSTVTWDTGVLAPWAVGSWHNITVDAAQNGSNVDMTITVDGVVIAVPSAFLAMTLGFVQPIVVNPITPTFMTPNSSAFVLDHLGVWAPWASTVNLSQATQGYARERADVRLARVFAEEGVPFALTGTSNITCGPQPIDTPLGIARDAEKSDGGVLYDGFSDGVGYITRSARYNMTAAFTIDAGANSQLAPPFEPVDDDQRTVNQFAASRSSGSSVTVSDTTSPLSVVEIGAFPQGDTFNVADDTFLQGIAGMRVNLGTVNGLRYPTMQINFINSAAAALAPAWMAALASSRPIGFRVDVINVATSAVNHPAGTLMLIVEGYGVTSDLTSWNMIANCTAFAPNRGFTLGSATQGRVDAANTTTNATLTATQTGACSMTVGAMPWVTTAAFPADFPLDINVNGEQITVSAIAAPTGSTQVFTISVRSVNGVRMTHAAGEKVNVWMPGKVLL